MTPEEQERQQRIVAAIRRGRGVPLVANSDELFSAAVADLVTIFENGGDDLSRNIRIRLYVLVSDIAPSRHEAAIYRQSMTATVERTKAESERVASLRDGISELLNQELDDPQEINAVLERLLIDNGYDYPRI